MKKIIILTTILFTFLNVQGQLKVMKNGRVAIGSNNIDSNYKAEIFGNRFCSLSLVNNHISDYEWSMISNVNRGLSKCYIVGLDSIHTFYVLGKGQVYCKAGLIADNLIKANNGVDVLGNVNISNDLFVAKSITSNGTISSSVRVVQPNIFSKIGTWLLSDSTEKSDFKPITNALEKLTQIKGYTYKYSNQQLANVDSSLNGRYLGFKAQEIKDILPEVVSKPDFDSVYYVNYGQIAALLVEGVKSVNKTVDSLSNKITELQNNYSILINQNQNLNNDLIELKNRMDFCCPPQSNEGAIMGSLNVKNSFKIQPNPVQNVADIILHIEKPNSNIKILLTDLSGKIILSKKYEGINKKNQLDFSNLSNGIYHCSLVIDDNIVETKSIIHEK